ncbi:MAG: exodeoxyribonuclease III [Alphaproteobacteria bacterium]|nr:MAG: exodeoxyribonuclease III [Alphaproteobacteria bacterium]
MQHTSHHFVTWNVNSLRSRMVHVLDFIKEHRPDVVMLQELKCQDEQFPWEAMEDAGYQCAVYGQKSYNGVAIMSRTGLEDVRRGLHADDEQTRYIEAITVLDGTAYRVASVYVPNGNEVGSDKFHYKLDFFHHLRHRLTEIAPYEESVIIGGDYNCAYLPQDVYDADRLEGTLCFHPQEREAMWRILHDGYYDAVRMQHPHEPLFSWWDYRAGAFARNHGMRIDHLLLSPKAANSLSQVRIFSEERAKDKPSDHAPVGCMLIAREDA